MVMNPEQFTEHAREIIGASQELVRRYKHSQWDVEHVLMALLELEEGVPVEILKDIGAPIEQMRSRLRSGLETAPNLAEGPTQIFVTPRAAGMLRRAEAEAQRLNDEFIGTEHLLIAIAQEDKVKQQGCWPSFEWVLSKSTRPFSAYGSASCNRCSGRVTLPLA